MPVGLLRVSLGDVFTPVETEAPRVSADQIYEAALRLSLQVIVEPNAAE